MAPVRRATIVVLEDSPATLELIDQALRASGHRVLVTKDPMEVVELAQRVRIDLFITDLARFRPEQQAILTQLCSPQPGMRLLLITGDNDDGAAPDSELSLRKPFSLDELAAAVGAALDREP